MLFAAKRIDRFWDEGFRKVFLIFFYERESVADGRMCCTGMLEFDLLLVVIKTAQEVLHYYFQSCNGIQVM